MTLASGPNIPPPVLWRPPASGCYTAGFFTGNQTSGAAFPTNTLIAMACILPTRGTYSDIAIRIDTGQGGATARLGVYDTHPTIARPDSLIEDAGEFAATGAGFVDEPFAANLGLGPGLFWLVLATSNAAVVWERTSTDTSFFPAAEVSGTAFVGRVTMEAAQAYGALPATFPASMPTVSTGPRVLLKVA